MKKFINDPKMMIRCLFLTSILMFISIFTLNSKVMSIFMTIWIINVFHCLHLSITRTTTVENILNSVSKQIDESRGGKKVLYFITIPFMVVGMLVVGLQILCLMIFM